MSDLETRTADGSAPKACSRVAFAYILEKIPASNYVKDSTGNHSRLDRDYGRLPRLEDASPAQFYD